MTDTSTPLLRIFQDIFGYTSAELPDTVSPDDVEGWDSMQHLTLAQEIEAAFGVRLTTDDILAMTSVGEIRRIIASRMNTNC